MEPRYVRVHAKDNVAIIVNPDGLPAGTSFDNGLTLREAVPQSHKVALADIPEGAPIVRYGEVIGHALLPERLSKYEMLSEHISRTGRLQFHRTIAGPARRAYRYPDIIYHGDYEFTLGGRRFVLFHARGETDDGTVVHVPDEGVVFAGDLLISSWPNLGNPFKVPRYGRGWYEALERIQRLNPRVVRVAALPAPSDREKTQWYFQRYVPHLPAGGEIVLFDRSWYNRSGVERVMGFATEDQVDQFFNDVPEFERMLVRSGIILIKYWFSITDEEQEFRFRMRIHDPLKQWKLSPMDLESRRRWEDYTRAKEVMLERTHIPEAPWWVVAADDKKRARLNCIQHLLDHFPYHEVERAEVRLPERERHDDYARQPVPPQMFVPERY